MAQSSINGKSSSVGNAKVSGLVPNIFSTPNVGAMDRFGIGTGINNGTVVVGAYYEDSNQVTITNGGAVTSDNSKSDSGAVYVFK